VGRIGERILGTNAVERHRESIIRIAWHELLVPCAKIV
jgi:hypothetical protein